ncbi:MAG TPA: hypothetical protein VGJ04_12055 [Pirellulales bacterium]|jgi:hypothetical protein
MKVIFPSFAWFALAVAMASGQSNQPPPGMSIAPQNVQVSPAEIGSNPLAPPASAVNAASTTNAQSSGNNSAPASLAPPNGATSNGAELFIGRVADAAGQWRSVQARIRYHANLFGQQTVGAGIYLQQGVGTERQFRLELKTAVGDQLLTLQQVCDGRYLWQYRDSLNKTNPAKVDAGDRPSITRIDLAKVRQTLQDSEHPPSLDAIGQMAVGGLPKLLDGLQHCFRFSRVEGGQLDTMPVWIAAGSWLPDAIAPVAKELAEQAAREQPLNLKLLPARLPEQVWLYVGQDDFFPYRIEFRRRAGVQGRGVMGAQEEMLPIVTVEFYEVRLNVPINPREFDYQPGSADIIDATASFLKEQKGK